MLLFNHKTSKSFGRNVQIAFWVVVFSSSFLLGMYTLEWRVALYRSLIIIGCHVINFYGFYSWIVPVYYKKRKYLQVFLSAIFLLAALTPLRLFIADYFLLQEAFVLNMDRFVVVGFVIFIEVAIASFASLMRLAIDHEITKQQVIALEKMHLESELRFLKAQMNPHFLFNTINNIYSLTLLKSDKAPQALMRLSGLLRYLLYESHERVPLSKEIQALQAYAELFRLKYENTENLTIHVNANEDRMIEPLVLIPILENALKHSGVGMADNAYANFTIYEDKNYLVISSDNSKIDLPMAVEKGGIGLKNIEKRLQLAYPESHVLKIAQTEVRFTLTIKIPLV